MLLVNQVEYVATLHHQASILFVSCELNGNVYRQRYELLNQDKINYTCVHMLHNDHRTTYKYNYFGDVGLCKRYLDYLAIAPSILVYLIPILDRYQQ